jgi:nucleoside-diphosphate-sugar epimerase
MLGRSMVRRLLAAGVAVRAMVRPSSDAADLEASGVQLARVDASDRPAVQRAVEGCQLVFHALGHVKVSSVFTRGGDLEELIRTNVDVTERLLDASLKAGVTRFAYVSSTAVYSQDARVPIAEDAPVAPPSDYGHSKWLAEGKVREYGARGLPTTIVRPCVIYGPGDRHFIPTILPLTRLPVLPLAGGGRCLHDFVYVDDVTELMWRASRSEAAVGQAYNSASGAPRPLREYIECLRREIGRGPRICTIPAGLLAHLRNLARRYVGVVSPGAAELLTEVALQYFSRDVYYDVSRARRELGYVPAFAFERGLAAALSPRAGGP